MSCPEQLRTQAFIDGAVAGAEAAAAERHIEGCAECQAFCVDAAALSDAIGRSATRHVAPAGLRRRVEAALAAEEATAAPSVWSAAEAARARRRGFWRGAFGGAGITGLAAGLAILLLQPPSGESLADQITDAHVRALTSGRAIAVASSDHHAVKPWFAGRIDISPPVHDFAAQGFKLTGGRLDRAGRARAAVVVYQHGLHEVDLFVWPDGGADRGADLPAQVVRHGYHAMFWKSGDLNFAAVSDTGTSELADFVSLVRAQRE